MSISPLAGKPAEPSILVDVSRLVTAYYTGSPDPSVPSQRVAFGTSGHRGSSFENAFNEAHILAITQAICLYRREQKIDGPLYLGIDTHALSTPAFASALGARGERRGGDDRPRRRLHADPGEFVRDSHLQPRARTRARRRIVIRPSHDRRNSAASSTTRRTAARRIPK